MFKNFFNIYNMLKTLTDRVSALEIENKALHEKILKNVACGSFSMNSNSPYVKNNLSYLDTSNKHNLYSVVRALLAIHSSVELQSSILKEKREKLLHLKRAIEAFNIHEE